MRPTLISGAIVSLFVSLLLLAFLFLLSPLSLPVAAGLAIVAWSMVFSLGLRVVSGGKRAIVVVLGKPNDNGEEEYSEGLCWIYPLISRLEERSIVEQSSRLRDVIVETGDGIRVTVSLAIQWSFCPTQLHLARQLDAPAEAMSANLEGRIKLFLGYVEDPADVTKGELTRRLGEFLLESVQLRSKGITPGVRGSSWHDLQAVPAKAAHQPWGVAIHSLEVIKVDLPSDLREALHAARVDEITADVAAKVGKGMADLMTPVLEAGGSPELAQQQAQLHQKPRADVIEPQPRTVVIPTGALEGDVGAMLTARAIADRSGIEDRRRLKSRPPAPQPSAPDPPDS